MLLVYVKIQIDIQKDIDFKLKADLDMHVQLNIMSHTLQQKMNELWSFDT